MMAHPVLRICNLTIDLPGGADRRHAVEDLSFEIQSNEIVCIVGESGSGKSMTSYAAMGLLPDALQVSSGAIEFLGKDVLTLSERQHAGIRGNQMAMIFQEPMTALNPCFTVGEQIEEVFSAHTKMTASERREKTIGLLSEVQLPEPERIYRSYPHQLSGGQRQRIVIAIALALSPRLLIADEPTTALDVTTQAQILTMFKSLKEKYQAGIMFVTHDFDVVMEIADRVVVMERGKIVEQGTIDDVIYNPQHPYTKKLIAAVPRYQDKTDAGFENKPVMLKVINLEKTYAGKSGLGKKAQKVHALHPTSFVLRQGETLGIVGESGSGKSTLVRCLTRLIEPDSGEIHIQQEDIVAMNANALRKFRRNIQIVFQDPFGSFNPRRRIGDQLILGALNFGMARKQAWSMATELLALVQIKEDALYRYPSQFSGGQRQRLCIARALMVEPKVLIADEAVSALDVSVQNEVLKLLDTIKRTMGVTILFITHDLRVAAQISDRLIVMSHGRVVEEGSVHDVFRTPKESYTKQLIAAMPGADLFARPTI